MQQRSGQHNFPCSCLISRVLVLLESAPHFPCGRITYRGANKRGFSGSQERRREKAVRNRAEKMLGSGWNLPHQHKVCCKSQSEQGLHCLCVGRGSGEKTPVSPGLSRAIVSTSSKDDKTRGLSGGALLEREVCRGELDLAQ